jgi:hypothetical protein
MSDNINNVDDMSTCEDESSKSADEFNTEVSKSNLFAELSDIVSSATRHMLANVQIVICILIFGYCLRCHRHIVASFAALRIVLV